MQGSTGTGQKSEDQDAVIRDISASGASIQMNTPLAENSAIEIKIDGIDHDISGHVVRAFDDGVAVEFELEAAEEEALLREINALHSATSRADEF
ncbi:MAG: PilZ domain-containing protein [Rhodospirillaceae bacterium]